MKIATLTAAALTAVCALAASVTPKKIFANILRWCGEK